MSKLPAHSHGICWVCTLFCFYIPLALAQLPIDPAQVVKGNPTFQEAYQINILAVLMTFLLYGLFALILGMSSWLLRRMGMKRIRRVIVPLALVLLVLPWAEEAWLAWRFSDLCQDAGLHVYKTVQVDGYFANTSLTYRRPGPQDAPNPANQQTTEGYLYLEEPSYWERSKTIHTEWYNGQWYSTILNQPISRYEYRDKPTPKVPGLRAGEEAIGPYWWPKLYRYEDQIVDRKTGEIIARHIRYFRNPSVVNAMWSHFFGSGGTGCSGPDRRAIQIEALKPRLNP